MGILILGAIGLYLLVSIGVVLFATAYARKNGKSAKRWGWSAALVMYLIPFWDWLPTVAVHHYYCAKDSGFWVYKTVDQWKKENRGVTLILKKDHLSNKKKEDYGFTEIHQLDQRFDWVIKHHYRVPILRIDQKEEILVDREKNEVMERYVDFSTGYGNPMTRSNSNHGFNRFKFWLSQEMCDGGENRANFEKQINEIYAYAKGDGK